MSSIEAMTIQTLRHRFEQPEHAVAIAGPLLAQLGVVTSLQDNPNQFILEVQMTDPRYVDNKGNKRAISRQDVQNRAHTMTPDELVGEVLSVADYLGVRHAAYPFDMSGLESDAVLVTGGVLTALEDRADFAVGSVQNKPIYIVGGNRLLSDPELARIEEKYAKNPKDYKTEADAANLVAEEVREKTGEEVLPFSPRTIKPDNYETIREFLLRHPDISRLAVITTALYVPFTSYDGLSVAKELGIKTSDVSVYAGESKPEAVAKRTVDTYRSEVMKTLVSAARAYQAKQRRS